MKLRIVYITNIWNSYQASICQELYNVLGGNCFKMCLCESLPEERRRLGWKTAPSGVDWILGPPVTANMVEELLAADVAVVGDCPPSFRLIRADSGKLTIFMTERLWKRPFHKWRMLRPRFAREVREIKGLANRTNVHNFAIGAYAAEDVARIDAYGNRVWAWSYFASVNPERPLRHPHSETRLLWVGRMLQWKRLDLLLKSLRMLNNCPGFARLDIVGAGPERENLIKMARRFGLAEKVYFHEPVPPDQVRTMMQEADVYVLPSNRVEGWGVVANEAISEGCVLVANEQAGASRELIQHGKTGFLFRDDSPDDLAAILHTLFYDQELAERIRQAAWGELNRLWHPRVGAERLIALSAGLLGMAPVPKYTEGPCRNVAVCNPKF
jgi:glycosyltransferase involved in cell wall biosynthesis